MKCDDGKKRNRKESKMKNERYIYVLRTCERGGLREFTVLRLSYCPDHNHNSGRSLVDRRCLNMVLVDLDM
jgi:hypothetical protein